MITRPQPSPQTSPADLNAVLTRIAERAERHRAELETERYASQVIAVAIDRRVFANQLADEVLQAAVEMARDA